MSFDSIPGGFFACPIRKVLSQNRYTLETKGSIPTGWKVLYATVKALELLAIPLLAAVSVAWLPLGLLLLLVALAMRMCGSKDAYSTVIGLAIWPLSGILKMFACTLGKGDA